MRPSVSSATDCAAGQLASSPRLRSGAHYATWRAHTEVWLERHSARRIHTRATDSGEWSECRRQEEQVKQAARLAALSPVLGRAPSSSSSAPSSSASEAKVENESSKESGDRSDPRREGVLTQNAGGQLMEAKSESRETVALLLNAATREQKRDDAAASDGTGGSRANPAQTRRRMNEAGHDAAADGDDRRTGANTLTRFLCDGHVKRDCSESGAWRLGPMPRDNEDADSAGDRRVQAPATTETAVPAATTTGCNCNDDDDEPDVAMMRDSLENESDYERENRATGAPVESGFGLTKEPAAMVTNEREAARLLPKAIGADVSSYGSGRGSDGNSTVARGEKRGIKIDVRDGAAASAGELGENESFRRVAEQMMECRVVRSDETEVSGRWSDMDDDRACADTWVLESDERLTCLRGACRV